METSVEVDNEFVIACIAFILCLRQEKEFVHVLLFGDIGLLKLNESLNKQKDFLILEWKGFRQAI